MIVLQAVYYFVLVLLVVVRFLLHVFTIFSNFKKLRSDGC